MRRYGVFAVRSNGAAKDTAGRDASRESRDFWYRIGVAFEHKDGDGINVELAAMPPPQDGVYRVVLRAAKPGEEEGTGEAGKPGRES